MTTTMWEGTGSVAAVSRMCAAAALSNVPVAARVPAATAAAAARVTARPMRDDRRIILHVRLRGKLSQWTMSNPARIRLNHSETQDCAFVNILALRRQPIGWPPHGSRPPLVDP